MQQIQTTKTILRESRLARPVVGYLLNFLDEYRLFECAESCQLPPRANGWPQKNISLVVVCHSPIDGPAWLEKFGKRLQEIERIFWLGPAFKLQALPPVLAGKITFQSFSGSLTGRDVNAVIQSASAALIVLVDTGLEPDANWLDGLLAPFSVQDQYCDFSLGQVRPLSNWRALALYSQMWAYLPFAGVAFRKQAWARAGGLPESAPLHPAWVLFAMRLKSLPTKFGQADRAVAQINLQVNPVQVFMRSFEHGQVGLFAGAVHRQGISFGFALAALVLAIIFPFFLSVGWLLLPGLIFLVSTLMAARIACEQAGIEAGQSGFFPLLLIGFLRQVHFLGYVFGVFGRRSTRLKLEKEHEERLSEALARHRSARGIVVYLPTHDWGFMFQRPHQLARHFARIGYLYFYCTRNEHTDAIAGFQEVEPNLFVCSAPPETFSIIHRPIFLVGSPWYAPMLEWFDNPLVIYDHYDDLEVSAARLEDHQALLRDAEIVLTTSHALLDAVRPQRPDALLAPNAVDYDFVVKMRPASDADSLPSDLRTIAQPGAPVIGYSGALAAWFDYELVRQIAALRPDWQFVLMGVDYDGSLGESGLLDCPNVHYLGLKSYQELFSYVWRFSVAIIPFVLNEITRATSPVKLFEYFACQKPVVATPLPECLRYPEVLTAADAGTFVTKIEQALEHRDTPQFLKQLDALARLNTWQARVEQIEDAITSCQAAK